MSHTIDREWWKWAAAVLFLGAAFGMSARTGATNGAEIYDLVIASGRVMDPESGLDAVRNLGIRSGKIAAISSEALQGKQTIDAKRSEEHTSELQSHSDLVCRLLLEKK